MQTEPSHNRDLLKEIEALKLELLEANSILDAIRQGEVDSLVLHEDGEPAIYSIASADYTYRLLIENFGEGALSITEEGLILFCNNYFSSLVGIPANKLIGTYFNSYVDSVGLFQGLKADLVNGPSKGEIVLNFNGKKLPVYLSLTDLRPMVEAIGVVITDLSSQKRHEEEVALYQKKLELRLNELNQTNANLIQFIHVISHDIKEPLRKMVAYSNHLNDMRREAFEAQDLKYLNVINTSAMRLTSLVDDLVKYSSSSTQISMVEADLNVILKEVEEDLELLINGRSATVQVDALPVIWGNPVQMRQLFMNLVVNAIKFCIPETKPSIYISADVVMNVDTNFPNKKFHKISVHDNGIGIEKNQLSKIFLIFQRLHAQKDYSGNGVGLAICKKIMENHLGSIEVESMPGKGSIFHVFFPFKSLAH